MVCATSKGSDQLAYAQTDQSLCVSLNYYMSVKLLIELNLVFLSLTGGCTGLSESTIVKMAHCLESHVTVHFITCSICGPVHEHLELIAHMSSEGLCESAHMRRLA